MEMKIEVGTAMTSDFLFIYTFSVDYCTLIFIFFLLAKLIISLNPYSEA